MNTPTRLFRPPPHEDGLSLLVALIVLVAMSLAGVALIRSVDTNSLIASNMAFRQTARESTDAGIEAGRSWIMLQATTSATTLESSSPGFGYYATRTGLNLTGNGTGDDIIWTNNDGSTTSGSVQSSCLAADSGGNVVCYVVQRMCDSTGPLNKDTCDVSVEPPDGGRADVINLGLGLTPTPPPTPVAIYRITVRAAGPRNNLTYTQVFVAV